MAVVQCYIWTMARKSNVNPNHFKTEGREPQGQAVVHEVERQQLRQERARLSRTKKAGARHPASGKG